ILVMFEIDVPRKVGGTGSNRNFDGRFRMFGGNPVEICKPDRSARNGAAVDDTTPIVEYFFPLTRAGVDHRRMRLAHRVKPADALVHVPAERTYDADVVVVPHVAVSYDVQTRFLLITDHRPNCVVVSFFVLNFLKRDLDVATK